jgi:hypothetical protein
MEQIKGMEMPDGALKVAQTIREWDAATANYANGCDELFDSYEYLFEDIANGGEGEDVRQDWKELMKLRQARQDAQEAFLKAAAGWSGVGPDSLRASAMLSPKPGELHPLVKD